jgi:PTS system nitrogen regulatory IIA component
VRTPIALGREAGILAVVLLREPLTVNEPAPDEQPISRLLFFVAPSPRAHLELLAQLSRGLSRGNLRKLIYDGVTDDEIFAAAAAAEMDATKEGDA